MKQYRLKWIVGVMTVSTSVAMAAGISSEAINMPNALASPSPHASASPNVGSPTVQPSTAPVVAPGGEVPASVLADLTGMWRIKAADGSQGSKFEFMLEASRVARCLDVECATQSRLFRAETGGLKMGNWNLVGVSLDLERKGHPTLRWTRIRGANDGDGSALDGEFSMILGYENVGGIDRLYLGGDYEEEVGAIMERIPNWKVQL